MDASNLVTAAVFSAFLKCPTKAHLLATGDHATDAFFADIESRIKTEYKALARRRQSVEAEEAEPLDFERLWHGLDNEAITHHVDCDTAVYDRALSSKRVRGHKN